MSLTFPDSPVLNEIYSYGDRSWTWDGTSWNINILSNNIGNASIIISSGAPVNARANQDFWWNSNTGALKIYYNDGSSTQWVDTFVVQGAQSASTGISTGKAIAMSIVFGG